MALETKITQKLDNNFVEVETTSKRMGTRYYKVPEQKADTFSQEIKQHTRNSNILNNTVFGLSIMSGILAASVFTKKLNNSLLDLLIKTASGITFATISVIDANKFILAKEEQLLERNQAEELEYTA